MFTPQQCAPPRGSVTEFVDRREKGKVAAVPELVSAVAGGGGGVLRRKELVVLPGSSDSPVEENGFIGAGDRSVSERKIWKQFKDAGALDEESLERKDRAALVAHISSLEAELYDYQYQMGLLLLESKSWGPKYEKMKCAIAGAEENLKREQAAHMIAIAEAERREDALKKALSTERQCVALLEKALKEMQAELAEVKEDAAKQISQAKYMLISLEEKSVNADSRLHSGEAMYAQASRKQADAERKLQEVQAREDALRREQQDFKNSCGVCKSELDHEEANLREWKKRLQDGQNRLLDGEKSLNKREEFVNQKESDLKKLEEDIKLARKQLEQSLLQYKQDEIDLQARVTAVSLREESAVKAEVAVNKKEQEVLLLQERVASRECIFEQHEHNIEEREMFNAKERERLEALDRSLKLREDSFTEKKHELDNLMKTLEETREEEIRSELELKKTIDELDRLRELMKVEQEDLRENRQSLLALEMERSQKEEKLLKREQQLEKRTEKLKEREKDLDGKLKALKERERALQNEEKQVDADKRLLEQEKEGIVLEREELKRLHLEYVAEGQRLEYEKEKLKAIEQEREDLLLLQNQLKGEIDEFRAQKYELNLTAEELRKEKEKFEKEWELLDERNEQLKKEQESLEQETQRISKWVQDEEEKIRKEKREMHEKNRRENEAIRSEKKALLDKSEADKRKLLEILAKERDDLARDIEVQRVELERSIEMRRAEVEKEAEELKSRLNEEILKGQEEIQTSREGIRQASEEFSRLQSKFDEEKEEILSQRKEADEKWLEIKKDIEELQLQQEKLKNQRESLRNERQEMLREAERLRKLRDALKEGDESTQISEQQPSHKHANDSEALSPRRLLQTAFLNVGDCEGKTSSVDCSPSKVAVRGGSMTPGHLSWLQRCTRRFFTNTGDKAQPSALHDRSNGPVMTTELPKENKSKLPDYDDHRPDFGIFGSIDSQEVRGDQKPVESSTHFQRTESTSAEQACSKVKHTHSSKAVAKDTQFILQEASLGRGVEAGLSAKGESGKESDNTGEEPLKGSTEVSLSAHVSKTDQKGIQIGRKRTRRLSKIAVEEGDMPDLNSNISGGGKKRRRRKEPLTPLTANGGVGKGSSSVNRYNLRHSTIVNSVTQLAPVEGNGVNQSMEENSYSIKGLKNTLTNAKESVSEEKEYVNRQCHSTDANKVQQPSIAEVAELSSIFEGKIVAPQFQESFGHASQLQSHGRMDNPKAELGEGSLGSKNAEAKEVVRCEAKESFSEETSEPGTLAEQNSLSDNPAESVEGCKNDVNASGSEDEILEIDPVENRKERPFGKKFWDFLTT